MTHLESGDTFMLSVPYMNTSSRFLQQAVEISMSLPYYQTNSIRGDYCHGPQRAALSGSVGNPFDRVCPPTTSGDLQPGLTAEQTRLLNDGRGRDAREP